MSLETWWPHLQQDSRDWLVAHNGEVLNQSVLQDIERVGGPIPPQAWWVGETTSEGLHLSDAAIDWVEEAANEELPEAPSGAS